ncbi:rectifier potassium channel 2 [Seminavis robusta]|uniref:Rectifier potassium channel 2 n=1 Tax=Seminavis robusta TaxID=568900 RepID=A0A9N8DMJ2_9STRA|nr:rectifier potassium channel 2 [Seminavis robusta]|eukprot:Sro161_g072500.1 rectifier potassium channel 2 (701) ;mRNA; f:51025-53379
MDSSMNRSRSSRRTSRGLGDSSHHRSRRRSNRSPSPFRRHSLRMVPPPRPRFGIGTTAHMLPTSSLSPAKTVFSSKHRLIKRNLPFYQSKNTLRVTNQHSELRLFSLLFNDWFHVGLRLNLWLSLFLLLSVWTICILIFAAIYMRIDRDRLDENCGLGAPGQPIQLGPAFAFSLETCTTVGYGLPNGTNAFFENQCPDIVVAIYFQMVWSMMFNAFLFAFFFARIAKCESRGIQVIFSNKAIISNRPDVPYPCFSFRVFDVDGSFPVVEAHVRMYVVTQKSPIPIPLRIVIPNDDYGSMLMLSLPSQVVHAMDAYSPMVPQAKPRCLASPTVPHGGLHLRQVDALTNNRDDVICPVCGESYGTVERLIKHGKFNSMTETHDDIPFRGSHREVDWDDWARLLEKSTTWSLQQLEQFFRSDISEVLCIVEGIDPLASGTFQAIQSYQVEDIHFGEAHFADCVCLDINQSLVVDLDFFHKITPNVPKGPDSDRSRGGQYDESDISIVSGVDSLKRTPSDVGKLHDSTAEVDLDSAEKENGEKPVWMKLNLRHVPTPENATTPTEPENTISPAEPNHDDKVDDNNLEPRRLDYDNKPTEEQVQSGDLKPHSGEEQPVTTPAPPAIVKENSFKDGSFRLPDPIPQTSVGPARRFTAPSTDYERPPPLFTLDSDLQEDHQTATGRQPSSRSSMPGNMMNSLVTGKF